VPVKNSALQHTLAASPLLSVGSSLAGFSAVFALHANASASSLLSVRPFRFPASRTRVLWPLLTPADSAQPPGCGYEVSSRIPQASPDKSVIFPPAITEVYRTSPWRLWISLCLGNSSDWPCLKSSSCTLTRAFASGFLQIRPRGRHPCPWLMVGARQPPFRTFTVEMTPMLGVLKKTVSPGPCRAKAKRFSSECLAVRMICQP